MLSPRITLGVGALFLGGLVGVVVGALMVSRSAPPAGPLRVADDGTTAELARVVRELADEVAALRRTEPVVHGATSLERVSERESVAARDGASVPSLAAERIVAALERLIAALDSAGRRGSTAGDMPVRLVPPPAGGGDAELERLVARDWESLTREFMLWNRQQVLELLGRPDEIAGAQWIYRWQPPGSTRTEDVTFFFNDGFVQAVYR